MVKGYETNKLWAIFPPPIASIMQFTAEFIQQKHICLRALWYFFPQHICINWCLPSSDFQNQVVYGGSSHRSFHRGKKKVQHFEVWQLWSSIKNSSKFTVRANRHSLPPTETRQSLTSAPLCSQTGFAHTQRFKEKCSRIHTHRFTIHIYACTHSHKTSGECRWWCTQVRLLLQVPCVCVDVCLCVRACVDKDLSRKKVVHAATANKKCWIWASNHQPIWNMLHLWGRCTLRRSLMVALKRTPAISPFLA